MKLKLFIEQTGKTYTINPNREYVVGTSQDCDIALPNIASSPERYLKLGFNQASNIWHAYNIGINPSYVNNQPITDYPIKAQTKIVIAGGSLVLVVTPELAPVAANRQPTNSFNNAGYNNINANAGLYAQTPGTREPVHQPLISKATSNLKVLNWGEYVELQAAKAADWLNNIAIRYAMTTGIRNTPWIAFDGYTIPNFKEPADKIASGLEANLDRLRQYEDTDCHVVKLTDAHLDDSTREVFSGTDLSALKRAGKRDFRRFCIVSHHRIRSYVIVENYGADLFIARLTRFESEIDGTLPGIFAVIALIASLITGLVISQMVHNFAGIPAFLWSFIIFGSLWYANFMLVPYLMIRLNILPKSGNVIVVWLIILFGLWAFFGLLTLLFR
ncbi:hypothetical protein [Nostoc sp.]|uniref:hypothetical protein n=1 Tax=Nostoc sp. TaxID=1180 RepID=UPI002FF8FF78